MSDPPDFEGTLQSLYKRLRNDSTGVLEHLGLPADATWKQFRARYSGEPLSTTVRVYEEAMQYEPFAAMARAAATLMGESDEKWLHSVAEEIERLQEKVMEHGRPQDRQALADLMTIYREATKPGKTTRH